MTGAGALRHKVTIQRTTGTQDGYGQEQQSWTDVTQLWAAVLPLTGRELVSAQQTVSSVTHKMVIRYYEGITAKMRVKFDGAFYDIQSEPLNVDAKKKYMEVMLLKRDI